MIQKGIILVSDRNLYEVPSADTTNPDRIREDKQRLKHRVSPRPVEYWSGRAFAELCDADASRHARSDQPNSSGRGLWLSAVWLGDIPFDVPSFGNVGQVFDRFLDLGELAGTTERIALGVASIILPQRHPAHVAKAAASADVLSDRRLLLGIASGDCPDEYPAMGMGFAERSERFRESVAYIRAAVSAHPRVSNAHGVLDGSIDMLPKPAGGRLPLMITLSLIHI